MKNELKKTKVLQIVAAILAVAGILFGLQPILSPTSNIWLRMTTGCIVIAQVYIAVYAILGFRKKSAIFLKIFINFMTLSQFIRIVRMCQDNDSSVVTAIIQLIVFSVMVALAVNEDFRDIKLGRTKSLVFSAIVLIEAAYSVCRALIELPGVYRGGNVFGSLMAIVTCGKLALALSLLVAIYAKYEDVKKNKTLQKNNNERT